jgi:hypothetical protein
VFREIYTLQAKVVPRQILRYLIIGFLALILYSQLLPPIPAKAEYNINSEPISLSARNALEYSLAQSVDSYEDFWQTVGTAAYNGSSETLDIVLDYDNIIEDAAAENGIDKAVIQSILFQEIRFINFLDEVDTCVQNTLLILRERETQIGVSPLLSVSVIEPVLTGFYISDSSTGLGQIYAKSAIKALNWYNSADLYDYDSWKDREEIWLKLKYDDSYNIHMIGLICRYNDYILKEDQNIASPSVRDILRTYNGSGPSAERYEEVTYQYYLAFTQYNEDAPA